MIWSFCPDTDNFLEKRQGALLAAESINCQTWAAVSRTHSASPGGPQHRFLTHDDGATASAHAVVSAHLKTLLLSSMSEAQSEQLVAFLDQHRVDVESMEGPREAALHFAATWSQRSGRSFSVEMNQALYELRQVTMPEAEGGQLLLAAPAHAERLSEFVTGFLRECFPSNTTTPEQIAKRVARLIDQKKGYFWCDRDGSLVSMAAIVRESPNTTSISLVYTPPKQRGRGHAARVVAALSQAQLESGKIACNLHTDLDNPTSNGVYIRLGYDVIQHRVQVRLVSP